jgi:hypothetical protein
MEYQPDFKGMGKFLRGADARRVCTLAAAAHLARSRAIVGKDSHGTANSGHLEHGIGGVKKDRVRVSVVFNGAAVEQQWGRGASRFLTRGFEGA